MPPAQAFVGAGIYAIYYSGSYAAYEAITARNVDNRFEAPIYVGKAIPPGARRGGLGLDISPGVVLYNRLREHSESITHTSNLHIEDFFCRYLVVDDIWIPLGESLLIELYAPIWNVVIDGFGNHDPGGGRRNQQKSAWDVLHPGRRWAELQQPNRRTEQQIQDALAAYIQRRLER